MLAACGRNREARVLLAGLEPGTAPSLERIATPVAPLDRMHAIACERLRTPASFAEPGPSARAFDWRTLL
jgi:hypothetical protein